MAGVNPIPQTLLPLFGGFSLTYGWEGLANPGRMLLIVFYIVIGLVLLVKGGDWFVDGAVWFAEKFKIPKLLIGATIVSIATTLPEFLVSVFAAIEGTQGLSSGTAAVDMATGNAIGSVLCNIGLILSLSMIFTPLAVKGKDFVVKPSILLGAIVLFWIFSLDRSLYWWEALLMILVLAGFFADNIIEAREEMKAQAGVENGSEAEKGIKKDHGGAAGTPIADQSEAKPSFSLTHPAFFHVGLFLLGVLGIIAGAQLLVDNATEFATEAGVPTKIIAVTIVAVGTSLPELITAVTSIIKRQSDLSVGNLIGASIIDQTLILPVCSFIYGKALPVLDSTLYLDLPFALSIVALAVIPSMFTKKLQRWQGIVCLTLYIAYLALSCTLKF
jgi:cation:H+ antiporter